MKKNNPGCNCCEAPPPVGDCDEFYDQFDRTVLGPDWTGVGAQLFLQQVRLAPFKQLERVNGMNGYGSLWFDLFLQGVTGPGLPPPDVSMEFRFSSAGPVDYLFELECNTLTVTSSFSAASESCYWDRTKYHRVRICTNGNAIYVSVFVGDQNINPDLGEPWITVLIDDGFNAVIFEDYLFENNTVAQDFAATNVLIDNVAEHDFAAEPGACPPCGVMGSLRGCNGDYTNLWCPSQGPWPESQGIPFANITCAGFTGTTWINGTYWIPCIENDELPDLDPCPGIHSSGLFRAWNNGDKTLWEPSGFNPWGDPMWGVKFGACQGAGQNIQTQLYINIVEIGLEPPHTGLPQQYNEGDIYFTYGAQACDLSAPCTHFASGSSPGVSPPSPKNTFCSWINGSLPWTTIDHDEQHLKGYGCAHGLWDFTPQPTVTLNELYIP